MNLDEAIKHCEEKAKELRTEAEQLRDLGEVISSPKQPYNEPVKNCLKCAKEHEQLAEWLKDYKRLLEERPQGEWITYDVDITPHPLHCKNCGWSNHHINNEYIKEFKVCPDCGAKMKGGAK